MGKRFLFVQSISLQIVSLFDILIITFAIVLFTGLTHYLGQDSDAEEMKSESKDFVLVAGT